MRTDFTTKNKQKIVSVRHVMIVVWLWWKWKRGGEAYGCFNHACAYPSTYILTFTPGKRMPRDWAFTSVQVLRLPEEPRTLMSTSGNVRLTLSHLVFSSSHPFLTFFATKKTDTKLEIRCCRRTSDFLPLMNIQFAKEISEFWEGTTF